MLKHISLDFWGTIARANPAYSEARTGLLAALYRVDRDTVKSIYTKMKEHYDWLAAKHGAAFSPQTCAAGLDAMLTDPNINQNSETRRAKGVFDLEACQLIQKLFSANPPFIDQDLWQTIEQLRQRGISFSIGSNLNFIDSQQIRNLIPDELFKFQQYSNECGYSKPSAHFFTLIKQKSLGIAPDEILHIGDSQEFDGAAERNGLQCKIVKNPAETLELLQKLL